jgi:hypothetical protein
MWETLKGKKTHILAILGVIWSFIYFMGWVDTTTYMAVAGMFGFATQSTQRAAVAKVEQELPPVVVRRVP